MRAVLLSGIDVFGACQQRTIRESQSVRHNMQNRRRPVLAFDALCRSRTTARLKTSHL